MLERVLELTGTDAPGIAASKFVTFRRLLLAAIAVELWELLPYWADKPHFGLQRLLVWAATAAAVAVWWERLARPALAAVLAMLAVDFARAFPLNANHQYLELILVGLLLLPRPGDARERTLVLGAFRWLVVLGLFHAGLQKLLHGYYFGGEFLAYAIARNEAFAALFRWILPAGEIARLEGLQVAAGAGPFRVESWLFVAISNATWVGELALPPLLLWTKTRPPAIPLTILYIFAIEAGAREIFFGSMMVQLVLLYCRSDMNRRLLPVFLALLAYVLAMAVGWLPKWYFS